MYSQIISLIQNLPFKNVDLLSVAFTIAAIGILGVVIYLNNKKSITNKTFFLFSIITILWSICNYVDYQTHSLELTLWFSRLVIFLAVWHSFTFFQFFYVFPDEQKTFSKLYKFLLVPYVSAVSLFTLTPFVFSGIAQLASDGSVSKTIVEKGVIFFIITVVGLIGAAIFFFIKRSRKAQGVEKGQYRLILVGTILTFSLLFTFNLILPAIFLEVQFVPLGALFIFPFIVFTFYAIYKHHLFNIKVAAIAFVAFILTIFSFFNIIYAATASQVVINITFFIAVLIGSFILIQAVLREIGAREKVQKLAIDLENANTNQVQLIHFVTHQVKGFFTTSRDIFSLLLEGEVGDIPEQAKSLIRRGFDSDTKGVAMVQDFLSGANIKNGTVTYSMEHFDVRTLVSGLFIEYKAMAQAKGLEFTFETESEISAAGAHSYIVNGDQEQLKQVFKNLIENSIKYTPKGSIKINLIRKGAATADRLDDVILFSMSDTGVGLSADDKKLLFTEGGRGKNSLKISVDSTGYGLFIAKGIVEAHHGHIWAESEGVGKGSRFHVELPAVN